MWLAQHEQSLDSQLIYLLIIAVLTIVGTIFGKKNKSDEKTAEKETAGDRSTPSRPPAVARPTQPPRPPAPPQPRPARPIPREYQTAAARPIEPEIVAEPVAVLVDEPMTPVAGEQINTRAAIPSISQPGARRAFDPGAIERRLKNPADLRTAFILSEILAPPVGLRENQQSV